MTWRGSKRNASGYGCEQGRSLKFKFKAVSQGAI